MITINAKKLSNGIFKLMLILFGILFFQSVANAQVPPNSDFCAREFEVCKFEGTQEVIYGANGTFVRKFIQGGSICSTPTFGGKDPVPNVVKSCYIALKSFDGDWAGINANGRKSNYVWRITQNGANLSFQDIGGTNYTFVGKITSGNKILDVNNKIGTLSANGSDINWSDGVIWRKNSKSIASGGPRYSYDDNPFENDPFNKDGNPYKWNGGTERTIYNPLDGGVFLRYTFNSQGNADGCSYGLEPDLTIYKEPCLAHDVNYDAPFGLMGISKEMGKELADWLFYKDMQRRAKEKGESQTVPDFFYTGVVLGGTFRGNTNGKAILDRGGLIAVKNSSGYAATLKVSWTDPGGTARSESVNITAPNVGTVPLSVGATNIKVECWAQGGKTVFTKTFSEPQVYAVTIGGTTLNPTVNAYKADTSTSYEIAVQTADEYLAGTDANIYVTICGTNGCTAENRINPEARGNAFERNSLDKFTLKDRDIGEVRTIQVRSDNQWDSPDWKAQSMTVTKGSRISKFIINKWFKDTNTAIFTESEMTNDATYLVQIKTADESGAGTDSNIFLKICGTKGCTVEKVVNPEIKGNAFEQNNTDQFNWTTGDVGEITYVEVRSDLSYGPGVAWKLEWVVIVKGKTFVCFAHKWFESKDTVKLVVNEIRP